MAGLAIPSRSVSFDIGARMPSGDEYRIKAVELTAKAQTEISPDLRLELENLALAYLRLAEQADRDYAVEGMISDSKPEQPAVEYPPEPEAEPKKD
jgi:hypothetical protein